MSGYRTSDGDKQKNFQKNQLESEASGPPPKLSNTFKVKEVLIGKEKGMSHLVKYGGRSEGKNEMAPFFPPDEIFFCSSLLGNSTLQPYSFLLSGKKK